MKKILASILLCMSALVAFAQPQRGGFRQLISYGGTPINAHSVIQMLSVIPNAQFTAEEAQRYGHEQLLDDMRALFLPYYRPTLSFSDINFMLAVLHSPEILQAQRHLQELSELPAEERGKYLTPAINAIMSGQKPEGVKLNDGISKEYLDACTAYYMQSGQAELQAQLKTAFGGDQNNEGAKNLAKICDYLVAYTPTVMANMAFGKVSQQDFQTMTTLYQTTPFQHFKAGNLALSSQRQNVLIQIVEKAQQWKAKKQAIEQE